MFTGIVETVGRVVERVSRGSLTCFGIEAPEITDGVRVGDSVAINGACLTVVTVDAQRLAFEAVKETLDRTSLGVLETATFENPCCRARARISRSWGTA